MAYALMQEICNHSFQGLSEGTACQARFNKLNIQRFREQLVNEINSGDADVIITSAESNFSYNGASLVEMNPYRISEGSLTSIPVVWGASLASPAFIINKNIGKANPTYNDILVAFGLMSGDQLTFLGLSCDDTQEGGQFNGFEFARVILEPASGNLSSVFISSGTINDANEKNRGDFVFAIVEAGGAYYLSFRPREFSADAAVRNAVAAGAVILSRNSGSVWQRSSQSLVLRPDTTSVNGHLDADHGIDYLGDAIQSFMTDTSSLLYLNQAIAGGKRGQVVIDITIASATANGNEILRDATASVSSPATFVLQAGGLPAGRSFKGAITEQLSGDPVKSADFVGNECTISGVTIQENFAYNLVLMEGEEVLDTYCSVRRTT